MIYKSINDITDAELIYIHNFCDDPDRLLNEIVQCVDWIRFGNTERYVASFGEQYSYSGIVHRKKDIPVFLNNLMQDIQTVTNEEFNSILLNFYPNNKSSIGWHSDNEKELGYNAKIASISLGQERAFLLRNNKTLNVYEQVLQHGSLLFMGNNVQRLYQHAIHKQSVPMNPRVNITFRQIKH